MTVHKHWLSVTGILPESAYPVIRPFFKQQYHASPYMEKYVLEALCMMGYYEDALERMKNVIMTWSKVN